MVRNKATSRRDDSIIVVFDPDIHSANMLAAGTLTERDIEPFTMVLGNRCDRRVVCKVDVKFVLSMGLVARNTVGYWMIFASRHGDVVIEGCNSACQGPAGVAVGSHGCLPKVQWCAALLRARRRGDSAYRVTTGCGLRWTLMSGRDSRRCGVQGCMEGALGLMRLKSRR
jgi:hypothetical protein